MVKLKLRLIILWLRLAHHFQFENFISDIDYLSPLGKSDHSVLRFSCNFSSSDKCLGEQLNYAKGVGLCKHMNVDWELCLAQHNNIEDMWTAFK